MTGSETYEAYLTIHDGICTLEERPPRKPDLVIRTPAEVWMDIMAGKADGQQLFMEGKYKVTGDLSLLLQMNKLFGK